MLLTISLVVFYLLVPSLLIYITHLSTTLKKIGAVIMAYAIGLIAGNIGILPHASEGLRAVLAGNPAIPHADLLKLLEAGKITETDILVNRIGSVQDMVMSVAILIALPLLLFSLDIRRWIKIAREGLFSLTLGVVSLLIVVVAGYFMFSAKMPEAWKVAGMLCGVYTGGTPNLAAIGTALEVNPETFVLTHTYDLVLGSVFLLFLLTIAQRMFNKILPHFSDSHKKFKLKEAVSDAEAIDNYIGILGKRSMIQLGKALGLSALIFGVSYALGLLVPKSAQVITVILSITTLGLLLGSVKSVSSIEKTFQLGMYFIIVFCLVVSSMADLRDMFRIDFLDLFFYVAFAVFGSMIVHVFLSWIFKIDSDTTIITITALTYSPPFVPVVAAAIKNKEIIITGITSGILGFAFGNYLGIGLAELLKLL